MTPLEGDWVMTESPIEWDQGLKVEDTRVLLASVPSAVRE